MASVEEIMAQLRRLRPEQIDEVATIVKRLAQTESSGAEPARAGVPAGVLDEAIGNGRPALLFTELIGSLPDLERPTQPPAENRATL
jgi:hypothetical protein